MDSTFENQSMAGVRTQDVGFSFIRCNFVACTLVLRETVYHLEGCAFERCNWHVDWVLMWGSPWWAARNQFSKQSVAHGPRTMRLDSTGVHWRDEGSVFTLFVAPRASISSRNAHSHSIKWPRSEILLRKISCLARRQLTTRKSVHGPGFSCW